MALSTALEGFEGDIIVIILGYLDLPDILHVRLTSRALCRATKDKLLWIYMLRHLVIESDVPLPPYSKPIESLDAYQIEAITIRVARLSRAWDSGELAPQCIVRMDLPRSVTWLRLLSARWLLVASSDADTSSFACYDFGGMHSRPAKPVAECFLSGIVQTGEIEMQDDGLIIALGVKARSPVVEVLTLRRQNDQLVFDQLASFPGFSHIRLLHGDVVGCAMGDNVSIPNLINWRTGATYPLGELPDENGCCLAMSFWLGYIILARSTGVQIFSTTSQPPRLLRTVPFSHYAWDVLIVGQSGPQLPMKGLFMTASYNESDETINFLVTSEDNAYLYSLSLTTFTMSMRHQHFEREEWPLRIRIGSSGRRMFWISGQHADDIEESPILAASRLYRPTTSLVYGRSPSDDRFIDPEITIGDPEPENLPGLWALATFDVDEATGLLALGNTFGELVLCDYVGLRLEDLAHIGNEITKRESIGLHIMPQDPIAMDVPPAAHFSSTGEPFDNEQELTISQLTSGWYRIPDVDVPPGWANDWQKWRMRWAWQGRPWPSDLGWRLEHSLHFVGQPEPLLYTNQVTFFRAGGLYFFWDIEDNLCVVHNKLSLDAILADLRGDGQQIMQQWRDRSETGQNEVIQFQQIWRREREGTPDRAGRNRWAEQQERGGKPHSFLLSST